MVMRGLVIALVVAVTRIARAAPGDEARAAEIFQHGRELAKAGQLDEACALFDQSYALDPALGTALNLADCLEQQGHLRRAWALFDAVARSSPSVASRAKLARQRADALLPRLPPVTVDAPVIVDAPAPAAPHDEPQAETRRRRSRVYLAGGIGAVGVVGLGVSLGLARSAKQRYDGAFDGGGCMHAEPSARCTASGKASIDRAGSRADLATGLAIGGALLAGVAAVLWWTAPDETVRITPIATARELGVGVVARF